MPWWRKHLDLLDTWKDMDDFLVTKFQIYFWGLLINQSIAILIYRNRSM